MAAPAAVVRGERTERCDVAEAEAEAEAEEERQPDHDPHDHGHQSHRSVRNYQVRGPGVRLGG